MQQSTRRARDPLPAGVTAHKLRHTFASILFVRGEDPPYVIFQLGHTGPAFMLRVYTHTMRRDESDKEALKALVEGRHCAPLGTSGADEPSEPVPEVVPENDEALPMQGFRKMGAAGFEPATSRV